MKSLKDLFYLRFFILNSYEDTRHHYRWRAENLDLYPALRVSVLERATHIVTSVYRVIVEDRDIHTVLAEKRWRLNVLMTLVCRDWRSNLYLPRLQDERSERSESSQSGTWNQTKPFWAKIVRLHENTNLFIKKTFDLLTLIGNHFTNAITLCLSS